MCGRRGWTEEGEEEREVAKSADKDGEMGEAEDEVGRDNGGKEASTKLGLIGDHCGL